MIEKKLKNIKTSYYPYISFILSALLMYMYLSVSQVLSTGRYCILQGDLIEIYVPAVKTFVRAVLAGENPFYSWSNSLGMNTFAYISAYCTASVFNIFYFLFYKLDDSIVWALVLILKTGTISACFTYSYQKIFKSESFIPVLFSLFYGLCSFQTSVNTVNIIWSDALYILPLLVLFLYQFVNENKWKRLVIIYFYLFIYNFYMAYMIGIFSCIFFVAYVAIFHFKDIFKILLKYAAIVILAIVMASFILLPAAYSIINYAASDPTLLSWYGVKIFDVYNQLFFGELSGTLGCYPYIYCGIPVLFLIPIFFMNKNIIKKSKIFSAIVLGVLVLFSIVPFLYLAIHAFDAPDGWGYRFAFIFSFVIAFICAYSAEKNEKYSIKALMVIILFNIGIYILEMFLQSRTVLSYYSSNTPVYLIVNLILMCIWASMFVLYDKWGRSAENIISFSLLILLLVSAECVGSGYISYYGKEITNPETLEDYYFTWRDAVKTGLNSIDDDNFYRINTRYDFTYNTDSYFGFNGINDFSTTENYNVRKFMEDIGLFTSPRITLNYGLYEPSALLLAVKYDLSMFDPLILNGLSDYSILEQRKQYLSLGFMVDKNTVNFEFASDNPFENLNDVYSCITGENVELYTKVDDSIVSISDDGMKRSVVGGCTVLNGEDTEDTVSVEYYIPGDGRPVYSAMTYDSPLFISDMPYFIAEDERFINEGNIFNVTYIKKMMEYDDGFHELLMMYPNSIRSVYYKDALFYYYNSEQLDKAFDILKGAQMHVDEYHNGYVHGMVEVVPGKLLYTSIPYDKNWSVLVDGVETNIVPLFDNAFIGIEFAESGVHTVEFVYHSPMIVEGILISLGGLLVFVILCIKLKVSKKNVE